MRIIANPTSRGGQAGRLAALITGTLDTKGISYSFRSTSGPCHAAEIARESADSGEDLVICIGGDGTVSEVARGLCGSDTALGIIPAGTGDDFARYLGVPRDPIKALDVALYGNTRTIDLGRANDRVFINTAGSGFDVAVLRNTYFYKKICYGLLAYLLGVLHTVSKFPPMDIEIVHSGGTIKQKCLLLSVANGRYMGGGMCVAPDADASDGLFDVYYVDEIARWKIPVLLSGFIKGDYTGFPMVHYFRSNALSVTTSDSSLQLDGEILSERAVEYRILPSALKVKAPLL